MICPSCRNLSIHEMLDMHPLPNMREELILRAKSIFAPAEEYFEPHFIRVNAPLHKLIFDLFQHLRICNRFFARKRYLVGQFTAASLDGALNALVAVNYVRTPQSNYANTMLPLKSDLLKELANYILASETTSSVNFEALDKHGTVIEKSEAIERFWIEHKDGSFPSWCLLNKQVMLSQPSSAVVERVFSAFKRIMHQNMGVALDDYVKGSLFSACNQTRSIKYLEHDDDGEVAEYELDIIGDGQLANNNVAVDGDGHHDNVNEDDDNDGNSDDEAEMNDDI